MNNPVSRAVVDEFYAAYVSRDAARIGTFLDDDVEWHVTGPIEVMHVCGYWRGKAAVIERFAHTIPKIVRFKGLEIESLLVDGNMSAMFGRISCVHIATGHSICHRVAHVVHYRDGKVVHYRVINDSLDAAEQYVGHRLTENAPLAPSDDFVVV